MDSSEASDHRGLWPFIVLALFIVEASVHYYSDSFFVRSLLYTLTVDVNFGYFYPALVGLEEERKKIQ